MSINNRRPPLDTASRGAGCSASMLTLVLTDQDLIVSPVPPGIESLLVYRHKSMDEDRTSSFEEVRLFSHTPDGQALVTHQGLFARVRGWCIEQGYDVTLHDARRFNAKPDFSKTFGMRFSQPELFKTLLEKNMSGLLEAPTRWGKTAIIVNTLRAFGRRKTVVCAPGVDLLKQLQQALTKALPGREVVGIYTGSRNKSQGADITVVSMDSLEKCDFEGTELVLVDEPHAAVTESRGFLLHSFKNARRYGFGATLHGRFDKADILIEALFGPVLARRTFVEAVNEGAICMIAPIIVRVPLSHKGYRTREMAYKHLLWENKDMVELIRRISEEVIPKEFQGLIFINNEKQADAIHGALAKNDPEAVVAMAKKLDTKSRAALFEKVTGGGVRRCVASSIYSTGVTFPDIRWAMNAEGMAAYISCVQKPGRLAEIKPGKKFGILFDFQFVKPACVNAQQVTAWEQNTGGQCLVNDSGRRLSIYLGKGYAVRTVPAEIDAIKKAFDALL